jgi:hypothetical protein
MELVQGLVLVPVLELELAFEVDLMVLDWRILQLEDEIAQGILHVTYVSVDVQ